jgi:hypothetical protein
MLGGPQSRSGRGGEEKNSQPLPGLEPPIIQLVAQRCTTELSDVLLFITFTELENKNHHSAVSSSNTFMFNINISTILDVELLERTILGVKVNHSTFT